MKKIIPTILALLFFLVVLNGCGAERLYVNDDKYVTGNEFLPGARWTDTEGRLIQAHGGQVQRMPVPDGTGGTTEKYVWVGENKTSGHYGNSVAVYTSDDLFAWTYHGDALRPVASRAQLETDEYFLNLYDGYNAQQLDNVYACINTGAVIERPKMLYNEKTGKYVIWFHNDGKTIHSDFRYDAGMAGCAVADSPFGPFRFIDRYRLNECPAGQFDYYPTSRGEARDMTLFKDDDGTAYIVYASENNKTLYISKLNEDYTYLSAKPDVAVYGKAFVRVFPGAMREAPVLAKADGRYYLMSSSTTGWTSNAPRYYYADDIFGEWNYGGNPCGGDGADTAFDTQCTSIFRALNGQWIYYGDRWDHYDLSDSRYVWLPASFDGGRLKIEYRESWSL